MWSVIWRAPCPLEWLVDSSTERLAREGGRVQRAASEDLMTNDTGRRDYGWCTSTPPTSITWNARRLRGGLPKIKFEKIHQGVYEEKTKTKTNIEKRCHTDV